jgi:hypothetical protein
MSYRFSTSSSGAGVAFDRAAPTLGSYDSDVRQDTAGQLGAFSRAGIAVGAFICAVSFSLFIYSISQLSSPIVSGAFIAAGIVLRQRATTGSGQAIAVGATLGGLFAAIASIALAAAGVGG